MRRYRAATEASVLTENEPAEAPHLDVLARLGDRILDDGLDRALVVADVRLLEQADFGIELVELAGHDLVDHLCRLALPFPLRPDDLALVLDAFRRHVLAAHVL